MILAAPAATAATTATTATTTATTTRHPVVLVHGVFGYGRQRPLWNAWAPYWPERSLAEMRANHIIVDVGALSSDHDRACEAFFQLFGGTVDYGAQHSRDAGHNRFGATFDAPLHPEWSANSPVHLLGHSFGATTALELYQLLCQDAFGVGSDHRWVRSITSIAGPLSGTTLTHLFGLHDAEMRAYTLGHAVGSALGLWFKLHTDFPVLKNVFDFRMPQWECVCTYREVLSATGRINMSSDLAVYNILPALRLARNSQLVHIDKVFLVSVVTSNHVEFPMIELALGSAIVLLSIGATGLWITHSSLEHPGAIASAHVVVILIVVFAVLVRILHHRMLNLNCATLPLLYAGTLLLTRRVQTLHRIFDGFKRSEWEPNDGVVNIHSMLRTWTTDTLFGAAGCGSKFACNGCDSSDEQDSTASTGSSSATSSPRSMLLSPTSSTGFGDNTASSASISSPESDEDEAAACPDDSSDAASDELSLLSSRRRGCLQRGRWYVHRVRKNHLAGTHFDRDAPQLLRDLLQVIAEEFERD